MIRLTTKIVLFFLAVSTTEAVAAGSCRLAAYYQDVATGIADDTRSITWNASSALIAL